MKSKTFCVLPWYSQEIKYIDRAPCCLLPKNYEITQIKKELLSGIRTNACPNRAEPRSAGSVRHDRRDHRRSDTDRSVDLVHQPQLRDLLRHTLCSDSFRDTLEAHPPDRQPQQLIHRAGRFRK